MTGEQNLQNEGLLDEAAGWVARLRSDNVSPSEKRRFSEWLNLSQEHEKAFDEVVDTWESLGAAAYLSIEVVKPKRHFPFTILKPFSGLRAGIAFASVCCAVILAYNFLAVQPKTTYTDSFATGAGQQQRIELPDGSVLQLNTQSAIEITYTNQQRNLSLLSGEAYFDVAPNKNRPFTVNVHQGAVEAVGTAFNIYVKDKETIVSVTEGVVSVREKRDASTPSPRSERLEVAQQISLDRRGLGQVSRVDPQKAVAWRENTLILDDMLLPEAISELNRYLQRPVNANDASLATLRVSGTFSLDAPEATLQALVTSFNLTTEQSSPQDPLYLRFE